jgi:hypothetical protein
VADGSPGPNHYVDITDTFERKLAAIRAHKSQTAHRDRLEQDLRDRLAPNSQAAGLPAGRLVEAFWSSRSGSWWPVAGLEQGTSLIGELPRWRADAACVDEPD